MATLFEPFQPGSLLLANRVFMAPLTRTRADDNGVPSEFAATYYDLLICVYHRLCIAISRVAGRFR
jgi:2,4-dienoyl-CoA reductase-like NADH-dependent reductase (Old Yellow Enzyme family)